MSMNFAELGNALKKVEDAEKRARDLAEWKVWLDENKARQMWRKAMVEEIRRKSRKAPSDGLPVLASRPAGNQVVAQGAQPDLLLGRLLDQAADPMN